MAHWLFLPDDAMQDLEILASLPPDRITALRGYLDSNEFRPRYNFFTKIAELLDITDESAAKLCTFINHVQAQRNKRGKDADAVLAELDRFVGRAFNQRVDGDKAKRLVSFLKSYRHLLGGLFSDLPKHDFSEKVRGLESGPLPHLHTFRTYLDLRPVYDAGATEIVQEFPVITLGLTIHSTPEDKFQEVVVQLAEDDLTELRAQLDRLDKKLALLKKRHSLSGGSPEGRASREG